jgi:hypothetical protein
MAWEPSDMITMHDDDDDDDDKDFLCPNSSMQPVNHMLTNAFVFGKDFCPVKAKLLL